MSSLMANNGKGWERIGEYDDGANLGHASDGIGFYAGPFGYVSLGVGDQVECRTRAQKKAVNQGLHAATGWTSYSATFNALKHANGAVIQVERHVVNGDGEKMWAIFRRVR